MGRYGAVMAEAFDMLDHIRRSRVVRELLAGWFEFDIDRADPVEPIRLGSGAPVRVIAGEGAGGSYYVSGSRRWPAAVGYASSEGCAGQFAVDLPAALEVIIALPYWNDQAILSMADDIGEMRSAAAGLESELREYCPGIDSQRARLRSELRMHAVPIGEVLSRLHERLVEPDPTHVLVGPDGSRYERLFSPS